MRTNLAHSPDSEVRIRSPEPGDIDALRALEMRVFTSDRLSRRSFRTFLRSRHAEVLVADLGGQVAGYALVRFRLHSASARLYSIAVSPDARRRGIGPLLLQAAEDAAVARECVMMRLEVRDDNTPAIERYRKAGYRQFGQFANYYEDYSDALRFEKRLQPKLEGLRNAPRYIHQTTDFTCGPACMMMALHWAKPQLKHDPGLEFRLWREATMIYMTAGHGGCGPSGLAVALKRRGLSPEIHVNKPGPYFLDTVRSETKRRVMRLSQADFLRDAKALGIPYHLAPLDESGLMRAFDSGAVALVLVSGYQLLRRRVPHWVFAFGHEGRYVLVHDPAADRDDQDSAIAAETYAVPWSEFNRMSSFGPDHLRATVLVRKGPLP